MPGLSLFRTLPVVDAVCPWVRLPAAAATYVQDAVTLGWEERLRVRARRVSDGGFEFATTLPRGTVLREQDCFVFEPSRRVVRVIERPEAVLVIGASSDADRALFAYHIGNSHQPLMIADRELVCPDIPAMEQVLSYHAIPFVKAVRPFTPVGRVSDHQHGRP